MAEAAGSLAIPKRIDDKWLVTNCPKLNVTQARALIATLRKKGWRDRSGSLADRVYDRLTEKVRTALAEEREAAKAKR